MKKRTEKKSNATAEITPKSEVEAPAPKNRVPRLSKELRAKADRIIAERDGKAPEAERKRGEPKEELVVFAFRLTPEERDLIHKAAGAAKASRFVRALAVAGAAGDAEAVKLILEHVASN